MAASLSVYLYEQANPALLSQKTENNTRHLTL